jgi:hypothetical protein
MDWIDVAFAGGAVLLVLWLRRANKRAAVMKDSQIDWHW